MQSAVTTRIIVYNKGRFKNTPPKFNSEFTPEKWWQRKMILSFWVTGLFSGVNSLLNFQGGYRELPIQFIIHNPLTTGVFAGGTWLRWKGSYGGDFGGTFLVVSFADLQCLETHR